MSREVVIVQDTDMVTIGRIVNQYDRGYFKFNGTWFSRSKRGTNTVTERVSGMIALQSIMGGTADVIT